MRWWRRRHRTRAVLVVLRQDDIAPQHPGEDITRNCERCGVPVVIYPSGQARLARDPTMEIVCRPCFEDWRRKLPPQAGVDRLE